jgi:hypothetical protein
LNATDTAFIGATLGVNGRELESLSELVGDPHSADDVLSQPQLRDAVIHEADLLTVSAQLYFYVLVRHGLQEVGIDDSGLADYIAGTLAQYADEDLLSPSPGGPAGDFTYHVDFLQAIERADRSQRFYLYVFSGNQFLVLTGLFPRFLERRERRRGAPGVRYYEAVAQGAFRSAGAHPLADEFDLREVYGRLSESFHQARVALNRLADEYLVLAN